MGFAELPEFNIILRPHVCIRTSKFPMSGPSHNSKTLDFGWLTAPGPS